MVHPDFKSQTGGVSKFQGGRGAMQGTSTKQKLNTDSSRVAELVGAHDVSPIMEWMPLFIEEQGHEVKRNAVYQDCKSAVSLENNGKRSSGKRTEALNIGHFEITDDAEKGDVEVECQPTDDMLGDFMSEGSQGIEFEKFKSDVMGFQK